MHGVGKGGLSSCPANVGSSARSPSARRASCRRCRRPPRPHPAPNVAPDLWRSLAFCCLLSHQLRAAERLNRSGSHHDEAPTIRYRCGVGRRGRGCGGSGMPRRLGVEAQAEGAAGAALAGQRGAWPPRGRGGERRARGAHHGVQFRLLGLPRAVFGADLEARIEKVIYACRFMAFLAIAGSLAGFVLCFLKGCTSVMDAFVECYYLR